MMAVGVLSRFGHRCRPVGSDWNRPRPVGARRRRAVGTTRWKTISNSKKKKKKQKKNKTCYRRAKLDEWVVGVLFRNRIQHPSFLDPMSRLKSSVSKTWSQFYITRYIEGPILKHLFINKYSSRTQPRVSCIYCLSHQLETAKKRSAALILVHGIRVQCWSKRFELNRSWNAAPIYEMMFAARVIFIDDRSYENPVTAESTLPHTQ